MIAEQICNIRLVWITTDFLFLAYFNYKPPLANILHSSPKIYMDMRCVFLLCFLCFRCQGVKLWCKYLGECGLGWTWGVKKVSRRCQGGVKLEVYIVMLCKMCWMAAPKGLYGCLKGTVWLSQRYWMTAPKVLYGGLISIEWPPQRYWMAGL